uniref:EGF-like domain-containing protein n=1 Tax=Sphenodon punctatus TaxID=8508 RepID=A0A8D0L3G6_SPHPU
MFLWVSIAVCNCQHGVCKHGVSGDGSCTCNGGYTGPKCDQELPHCSGITCGANSQCVVKNGVAVCDCMPGYQKSGAACRASNPCASSPCSSFADCKDLGLRKYECTCKGGYQGDGRICQPINPCVDNNGGCPVNSTLCRFRSPGQSSCICKPGMSGNPVAGCTSVNECRQYYCDRTSKCDTNPDGTVSCVCTDGEIGDGRSCYKNLMSEITEQNTRGRFLRKLKSANK